MLIEPRTGVDVSVVVPTYNGTATITECLTSVSRAMGDRNGEIIVVDSSSDGTAALVRERFPTARLHQSPTRLTAGGARNLGVARAGAKIVLFTDQDCVVPDDWVGRMLAYFEDPRVDGVGGTVGIGNLENHVGCALYFLEFLYHFPSPRSTRPDTRFLVGCNAAYRRAVLEAVPFPDQTLAEDVIFGHRVRAHGFRSLHDPRIEVKHHNKEGWGKFLAYNYEMGRASAAYHASLRLPRAAPFLRFPALAYALPLLILPSIGVRLLRSRRVGYLARFALLAPVCLMGNLRWAAGFRSQALSGNVDLFADMAAAPAHGPLAEERSSSR